VVGTNILKVLLHIMAHGHYEGKEISDPELRKLFDRETVIQSDWYKERLQNKQKKDVQLWKKHIDYISNFSAQETNKSIVENLKLNEQLSYANDKLNEVRSDKYLQRLIGTIGADLIFKK